MNFKETIRVIENFPEPGISFKDITTLLQKGPAFHDAIATIAEHFASEQIDLVVGPEARGFVIGAPVAYALKAGFIPVRKPGKLPAPTLKFSYDLEYGKDCLEIHQDAVQKGQRVIIIDDLLATGGTTLATIDLIEKLGGIVVGIGYLIELQELKGREKLGNYPIFTLIQY
ncbi:MAG: adenine phosphoribosyltransferase [Sporomusaceae bacterium]|nr:adenine phosphoribosyltransferase [Sporomusaceae bacterium]